MAIDIDGDGSLDRSEILEGLKASLPLDLAALEEAVESGALWSKWDPDGDGHVDLHEFLAKDGLIEYVMEVFDGTHEEPPIPHLSDRLRWFEYFDDDNSKTLSQEELVRAIVKTLDLKPPWTTDEANKVRVPRSTKP